MNERTKKRNLHLRAETRKSFQKRTIRSTDGRLQCPIVSLGATVRTDQIRQ